MNSSLVMTTTSDTGLLPVPNTTLCTGDNCTRSDDASVSLDADMKMRFVYITVGCLGMIGNSVVIGVILTSTKMRKAKTNVLIANQSAIDFSASLFIVLCTLIRDVSIVRGGIIAKEIFCRMWASNLPIWGLFVSSSYNLVSITLERFSGICHPMRHNITCSKGKATVAMAFTWLIGPAYNMAFLVPTSYYADGQCSTFSNWPNLVTQRGVGLFTVVVQFFIPLIVITVAYTMIVRQLRKGVGSNKCSKSENPQNANRQEIMKRARTNVVKTLVMVAASFVVCWSPNQIYFTMFHCGYEVDFSSTFYHFTVILAFANCCINPFIYSLQYDQFKTVMFRRCRNNHDSLERSFTTVSSVVEQQMSDATESNQEVKSNTVELN